MTFQKPDANIRTENDFAQSDSNHSDLPYLPRQLPALIPNGILGEKDIVPAHYGNPFREEEYLLTAQAFTDLRFLEVLSVAGADRLKWLHSLSTCAFLQSAKGESKQMLILDPNGKIEHAAAVVDDGERTWMVLDAGKAAALAEFLCQMKFMMRVEIVRHDYAVVGFNRPVAEIPSQIRESSIFAWEDAWPEVLQNGAHYGVAAANHPARDLHHSLLAFSNIKQLSELLSAAIPEWQPAGTIAWEAARIRAWRPRPNNEMRGGVLPHELDLLRTAVHLQKGCYRGQEAVAKIVNLGRPARRLTYLYIESAAPHLPEVGAEIFNGKRKVGVLTSVARDYEEGPVGLALLKRAVDPQAVLSIGAPIPELTGGSAIKETSAPKQAGTSQNKTGTLAENPDEKEQAIFTATQVEIVSHTGKSSVSPQQRPGAELLRRHER